MSDVVSDPGEALHRALNPSFGDLGRAGGGLGLAVILGAASAGAPIDAAVDGGIERGALGPPNRIYSTRELLRRAAEPGPFHNFPESFNQDIFEQGTRTFTKDFWRTVKMGLSNDSIMYRLRGTINGSEGTFEIGVRPSISGRTELIMHRFFRPDP